MDRKVLIIISVLIILASFGYHYYYISNNNYETVKIKFENGSKLSAYLADTFKKQKIGLAAFKNLGQNEGMIFVYNDNAPRAIWMKGMNYPIDVIWLDKSKKVVKINSEVKPSSYPKSFDSQKEVRYFIETNAGWVTENNIKIGQDVSF
jgi:hypothetical protein